MLPLRHLFLTLCFVLPLLMKSQVAFDNVSRAVYILDLAKLVTWSNHQQLDSYTIAILDTKEDLYRELVKLAAERKTLHDKPLKTKLISEISQINNCQVVFLNKQSGYDISLVQNQIRGKNILLISEGFPFHKSMLNFIVLDNRKRYEVNEKLLTSEGFSVNRLFLAGAVQNETDWQAIYQETEKELEKEKLTVARQKTEIEKQQAQIDFQKQMIAEQEMEIIRQKDELAALAQEISAKQKILDEKTRILVVQQKAITLQGKEIERQKTEMKQQKNILANQQREIEKQQQKIESQKTILSRQLAVIEKQKLVLYFFIVVIVLLAGLGYVIYRGYRIKKEANRQLEIKNQMITRQKEEIEIQRDNIAEQRDRIAFQKKQITDSIYYAQRIQRAILPDVEDFKKVLEHFFILYKPRDIVSGDFYWETRRGDEIIVVAADCTGHGVPGAFMSMLGVTLLNNIVETKGITDPGKILDLLRDHIIDSLNQQGRTDELRDGMDIAVVNINRNENIIRFAGANNPMFLIRDNQLQHFKGDNMPIAIFDNMVSFRSQEITLLPGDSIYIFSDGYIDQFGGEAGKKFLRKRLADTLLQIQHLSMAEQKTALEEVFEKWRGEFEQIDDVLVIGIRV